MMNKRGILLGLSVGILIGVFITINVGLIYLMSNWNKKLTIVQENQKQIVDFINNAVQPLPDTQGQQQAPLNIPVQDNNE